MYPNNFSPVKLNYKLVIINWFCIPILVLYSHTECRTTINLTTRRGIIKTPAPVKLFFLWQTGSVAFSSDFTVVNTSLNSVSKK